MRYDYACLQCGWQDERDVPSAQRDTQVCPRGHDVLRLPHFTQVVINQPKGFMTSKELVMGPPGSQAREEFEGKIRKGEIVPAGLGSRWI